MLKDECGMLRTDASSAFILQHFSFVPLRRVVDPRLLATQKNPAAEPRKEVRPPVEGFSSCRGAAPAAR
jgi:hypothetical protein